MIGVTVLEISEHPEQLFQAVKREGRYRGLRKSVEKECAEALLKAMDVNSGRLWTEWSAGRAT